MESSDKSGSKSGGNASGFRLKLKEKQTLNNCFSVLSEVEELQDVITKYVLASKRGKKLTIMATEAKQQNRKMKTVVGNSETISSSQTQV